MLDWPRLLRWLSAHRRHVRLLLLLWLLKRAWRPLLRPLVRRVHRALNSETPQLHYTPSPATARLLAACPALRQPYCAPWHLPNGHLQTLQLASEPDDSFPRVLYQRQTLDMLDGGIVSLDWAFPPRADGSLPRVSSLDATAPTLLVLPGLTGGSGEFYIRCVVHEMLPRGWQVVVLNARGCARTPLTTPQLFCCAYTDDLRFVLEHFAAHCGFSTLVAAGFSMGSNVLVKYLGEAGASPLVTAGVSVGNPFDLVACATHLKSTVFYRSTYDRVLCGNLQRLFFDTSNAHQVFAQDPRLDIASVRAAETLTQFDDRVTRLLFGYDSVHAYYADASSVTRLARVSVPLLCLNAQDDPISVTLPVAEVRANPHVVLCVTKRGGHLAFYEDVAGDDHGVTTKAPSWAARALAQFADSVRVQQQKEKQRKPE